jgi:hypothetical protein
MTIRWAICCIAGKCGNDECTHAVPHDPDDLDDKCLDEPCSTGEDLELTYGIFCIPLSEYKPPVPPIKLPEELFEI